MPGRHNTTRKQISCVIDGCLRVVPVLHGFNWFQLVSTKGLHLLFLHTIRYILLSVTKLRSRPKSCTSLTVTGDVIASPLESLLSFIVSGGLTSGNSLSSTTAAEGPSWLRRQEGGRGEAAHGSGSGGSGLGGGVQLRGAADAAAERPQAADGRTGAARRGRHHGSLNARWLSHTASRITPWESG